MTQIQSQTKRQDELLTELKDGPLSHNELMDRMDIRWYELTDLIRPLRASGDIEFTLGRKYQLGEDQ